MGDAGELVGIFHRLPEWVSYFSDARPNIDAKRWIWRGLRAAEAACCTRKRDGWTGKILCGGGNEGAIHATVQALRPFFAGAGPETHGPRNGWCDQDLEAITEQRTLNRTLEPIGCERVKQENRARNEPGHEPATGWEQASKREGTGLRDGNNKIIGDR
jgi:hypothetical protein